MAKLTEQEIEALQAEVKRLHAALGESEIKRDEAESLALANSQAGAFVGSTGEHPTGKTVSVSVCINPGERNEKKQVFKTVELPTYFYTIDLPAGTASASTIGSGSMLTTNGIEYYNGQTYEVDQNTLVDLKSRVARCWDHEKSIHGDNENAYRRQTQQRFISPAAMARGARH